MALPLVATAFGAAITYIAGKIGTDLPFKIVAWAFMLFVVGIFIAFVVFIVNAGFTLHGIIVSLLNHVENGGATGTMVGNFYGLLTCSGAIGGINATKGLVLSALVFRLLYFAYKHFVALFKFMYHAFVEAIGAKLT